MSALPALPDPRRPASGPTQPLHALAQALLTERDLGKLVAAESALDQEIARLLASNGDAALAEATATAPSAAVLRLLNERLRTLLSRPAKPGTGYAVPFLVPLVMVAGVRGKHMIEGRLPDADAVLELLRTHGIVAKHADVHLLNRLVDRDQLLGAGVSLLAHWRDTLTTAADGLPYDFKPTPIVVEGDGVYLRYLVGVAYQPADAEPVIQLNAPPAAWTLALSKLFGEQFKHDAMTLFPLPRVPQNWLAGLDDGRVAQQEIRFQVYASNTLRKLREGGEKPVAVLSCHENGELRVTLGAATNGENWAGFVWPLGPLDRVDAVQHMMVSLLQECQQDDIRVLTDVLPTIKDDLPYFPLPTELATTETRH
ncbi:hypothetical protein [Chitinimonas sp. BJYL2]|uniref:hypothetical protein n=1 Tax=Chitinimonas sp. BJYL2 TaxID=2976696 RepID=UPI0022B48B0D|nr:hypothetical protein [Chitinimonas sp. BJYL2]